MYISKFVCGFILGAIVCLTVLCTIALIVNKNDDHDDNGEE